MHPYTHATDCIGTYIVPTKTISDWTAQTTCRVFISGSDELRNSGSTISQPEKRKQASVGFSPIGPPCFVKRINLHVEKLHTIWQNRQRETEETWEESRIGRITGTSAKLVMMGKRSRSHCSCPNSLDCQRSTQQRKCRLGL